MKVKELIQALSISNPESDVVIGDADEGCTLLEIQWITDSGEYVELRGSYDRRYQETTNDPQ